MAYTVLVLGGYGNFGGRISSALAQTENVNVVVAGRSLQKAHAFARRTNGSRIRGAAIDINRHDLVKNLVDSGARLVIHTSGPFQGQDYKVAEACVESRLNYIDLADARDFVKGFEALDAKAKENNVLAVTGASSVPGLSSAVIEEFLPQFAELTEIDYGIAPGNRVSPGEATVKAILSYTGRPFTRLRNGGWTDVYGWQDIHRRRFPEPVGTRWLANCDIPDLDLFPKHYPSLNSVRFYAGLELTSQHLALWLMSWLARLRIVDNWASFSGLITQMSDWLRKRGTDVGGMYMRLKGTGNDGKPLQMHWDLVARDGHGPQIPTIPAIILAKKLADGALKEKGAKACIGLFSLSEFTEAVSDWNIAHKLRY